MYIPDERPPGAADERLQALFAAYRDAVPDPEPGRDFMPQLWSRIEAGRTVSYGLKRLARGIISAAAAAVLLMGIMLSRPEPHITPSYLELLAAGGQQHESLADTEIMQALHDNPR
jgi:hypothetical protein